MKRGFLFILFSLSVINLFSQFKPNQIVGLNLWLRADSGLVLDGTLVTQWDDCSGSGNNVSQVNSSEKPILISNILNGQPCIRFDGSNDFLSGGNILNLGLNSWTFFIVGKSNASTGAYFGKTLYGASANRYSLYYYTGVFNTMCDDPNQISYARTPGNYEIATWKIDRSIPLQLLYFNSDFKTQTSAPSITVDVTTNFPFNIGNYNTALFLNGEISEVIIYNQALNDTNRQKVENYLRLKYAKQINLGPDINIAYGFNNTTLNAHTGYSNYFWQDGSTDSTLTINKSGSYSVQANDIFGYLSKDTIRVTYPDTKLNYKIDTTICSGSNFYLKSVITHKDKYTFLWSNGATDSILNVNTTGNYWVLITDTLGYFAYSDTLHVVIDSFAQNVNLGNDTSFCSGNYLRIQPPLPDPENLTYTWTNGSHDTTLAIFVSGNYSVLITNQLGCSGIDSVNVTILGMAPNTNFEADTVCLGNPTTFTDLSTSQPGDTIVKWHWQFTTNDTSNLQNPQFTFSSQGVYNVMLTTYTVGGCSNISNKNVVVLSVSFPAFSVDIACRNNPCQFIDLSSVVSGDTINYWDWDFGDSTNHSNLQNPIHIFSLANNYLVTLIVQTNNGCQQSVSHILQVDSVSPFPSIPVIVYPLNKTIISDTTITFSWLHSLNGVRYKIVIALDSNFNNVIVNSLLDSTNYQKIFSSVNQTFYWKIYSYNICGDSIVTATHKFEIFSPLEVFGLKLWLNTESGVVLNGNKVMQWNDLSGNLNNVSQLISISQPSLIDNVMNGRSTLRFDGNEDFFSGNNILNLAYDSWTFFLIGKSNTSTGTYLGKTLYAASPNRYSLYYNGGFFNTMCDDLNQIAYIRSPGNYEIITWLIDRSIPSQFLFFNGIFKTQTTAPLISVDITTTLPFTIGSYNNNLFLNGDISEVLIYNHALSDTNRKKVENYLRFKYAGPPVALGPDIIIPYGLCDTTIDAGSRFTHFIWSTGDTTQTITVSQSGNYSVTATNIFGDLSSDTINVKMPTINISDTIFCLGDTISIASNMGAGYSYLWLPDSSTTNTLSVFAPGIYTLQVTDTIQCYGVKSFIVLADSFPVIASLGPDRKICKGDYIGLVNGAQEAISYFWSDGSGNNLLTINNAFGTNPGYSVTVSNSNNCIASDTIQLIVNGVKPLASFISDSVCLGDTIHFTNQSSVTSPFQIIDHLWDFGDSTISSAINPDHFFSNDGYHWVRLTVVTDSGCIDQINKTVIVFSKPLIIFSPIEGCSGVPIPFIDKTLCPFGNIVQWNWNFNDSNNTGHDTSSMQNPLYQFDSVGVYTVKAIAASDAGCMDSVEKTVTIKKSPSLDFSFTPTCAEHTVFFHDLVSLQPWETIISYHWQFSDGHSSSIPNPNHIFDTAGIYSVVFQVLTSSGCEVSVTKPIEVGGIPQVDFIYGNNCIFNSTQFLDNSFISNGNITGWHWSFGGLGTSVDKDPVFIFPDTLVYNVTLAVETDHNCKDSVILPIKIVAAPQAEFSLYPEYGVPPLPVTLVNKSVGATTYLWSFGDGETSILSNPVHTYQNQGIFTVLLNAFNAIGCKDSISRKVYLLPTTVDIAVVNANVNIDNGRMSIAADLSNIGTRKIENIDMAVDFGKGNILHAQWSGLLSEGESMQYKFAFTSEAPENGSVNYVCVKAYLPNLTEDNTENNTYCLALKDEFLIPDMYPNPVKDIINITYILPFEEQVTIEIVNSLGSLIKEIFFGKGKEGYNRIQTDISTLNSGVYTVRIFFRDKVLRKKFVKL